MSTRADTKGWLRDGNLSFHGGCDGSVPPNEISRAHVASAVNATMRGGVIGPRPGWVKRSLVFSSSAVGTAFKSARFQHSSFYASSRSPSLISSHGGRLFHINLQRFSVQEITPLQADGVTLDRNNPFNELGWSVQCDRYWIYQDNQSYPYIFNGSAVRRANPAQFEVPVGNVMAYAQGRLVVALPDRQTFRVGDLLFSPSGTSAAGYRDSVLKFTENNYLNEGGDFVARVFGAPSTEGSITAMHSVAMTDTGLGQGPLLVGTQYGVFTVQLPFDRTIWKDLRSPLQTNAPIMGPLGQNSMVLVNGDAWYRSIDGIRSYIMAQREFSTWGNTPMSEEIGEHLGHDTQRLLEHGSAVLFDNRLLMTSSPAPSRFGVFHRSLVSLDFRPISNMGKRTPPAYDGVWTGARILQIVKGMVFHEERCFAYVLSASNEIELWELVPDAKWDTDKAPIQWSFTTPSYNCGNSDQLKRLETARFIANDIVGRFAGTVTYRTDQDPCFTPWDTWVYCAKYEDCAIDTDHCGAPQNYLPQQRTPIRLHQPPDTFNDITGLKHRTGYEFQMKVACSGYGKIRQLRMFALDNREPLGAVERDPS